LGKLYIVGTPIGNLGDITSRAVEVLGSVDKIICEDSRVTIKLLNFLNIKKPLITIHEKSKKEKITEILLGVGSGKDMALVVDAGTPGVSDPGGKVVETAIAMEIEVVSVPGPSALTAALSLFGSPANSFLFLGFFPKKKGRESLLKKNKETEIPIIFYEAPTRIKKTLSLIQEILGDREVFVARELTKKFETVYRGKISEVVDKIIEKGEFVVIIKPGNEKK